MEPSKEQRGKCGFEEYPARRAAETPETGPDTSPIRTMTGIEEVKAKGPEKTGECSPFQTDYRERVLSKALSFPSDFVYIFDRKGRFHFANQPLLDLWGITLKAAVGKNFFDLGYPYELAVRLQRQVQEVFRTRERVVDEAPFTSPTGAQGFYENIFSPIVEIDGSVHFVVGSTRDTTDRKRMLAALEDGRQRITLATESAGIGVWDWDFVSDILVWDTRMYELYGIHEQDFSGAMEAWHRALHPLDRDRCANELAAAISGNGTFNCEFRVRWPNGEVHDIEAHGLVQRKEGGSATRMIGVNWDITERVAIEKRLLQQAELLDLAKDAIMVRDIDGRIQFWNRGAESVYGWTSAETVGKVATKLLRTDPARYAAASRCLLKTGEWKGELHQVKKDGTPVIIGSRWTLLRDQSGKPQSTLVISTDITEHKKLESQFLRAQRLESIGTLASGVAHDLNNILAPILLSVPLLREELPREMRDSILCDLETCAQRGSDIVSQVLAFARGSGGNRLRVQPIHLIKDIAHIAQGTFPKSIQVTTSYPQEPWSVDADPTQLHQVLMNLCVNARDAMPGGGELGLSAENFLIDEPFAAATPGAKTGPHVVIQVSDTGKGIPRKIIDKIFDPFFTTKEIGHGTGLGLSTSIGIVKSHGGFISVLSEEGSGTTFRVFLPAIQEFQAGETKGDEELIPPARGELVLLVDDEQTIRNMAAATLEKHGYQVVLAADGFEALSIFAARMDEINIIITDILMPLMDGITLIRTLQRMKPDVLVIASTGQSDEKRSKELKEVDVPVSLVKPYNKYTLLITVGDALKRPRGGVFASGRFGR